MGTPRPIEITYRFQLPDGVQRAHVVRLSRESCALEGSSETPPVWTELDRNKCTNCPLDARRSAHCPPARAIASAAEPFKDLVSHTMVSTEVVTEDRNYSKIGSLAAALGSLFGLVMATSGCPHLDFLRPMARFHLPFSTVEETIVRSVSFHLLRRYRAARRSGVESLELSSLGTQYATLATVNLGLADRIRAAGGKDSGRSAVVSLDVFAKMLRMEIRDELPILNEVFPD